MAQMMVTGGNGVVAGWCIAQLLDGSTPALPRLAFEVVDVAAAAHLLAMDAPHAAGERYIVSGEVDQPAGERDDRRVGPERARADRGRRLTATPG